MLQSYLPILLLICVGVVLGLIMLILGLKLPNAKPNAEKSKPYESGFDAREDARSSFNIRYYLVAILFILFDIELVFLLPWAVALPEISPAAFWSMLMFLGILGLGLLYEWRRGALEWD
ncbi:MAG: NADH-quinone oxidoreductase subunit A [Burkholderiales bacterium]|jgi:NADH-quinone oxidoreductase subunit A|nr:NADH-quinone oxidoreductase subunit A [Burkholderiales bacterium]